MKVCKYCDKEIEGKHSIYANHVRWCDKNTTNGDKGGSKISEAKKKFYEKNRELILHHVICKVCGSNFIINEISSRFRQRRNKYFCSEECSKSRSSIETKNKISESTKNLWKNEEYANKIIKYNTNRNKRFTSKGEEEIKKYLKENYKSDNWTSGGGFKYKDTILTRDIYSNDLKIIVEYDGIWHFKDIHGQLEEKKLKDSLLEEWVSINEWRIVRISDCLYTKDKQKWTEVLIDAIYEKSEQIIKIY